MSYCTVGEARARMGHPEANSVDLDARLTDTITAAAAQIESDTGRESFSLSVASARTFATPGYCYELYVPDFTTVTAVKVDDDDDGVFETTIAASGYELDKSVDKDGWPFDVIRLLDRAFPYGGRRRRRVEVTATWGWAAVPSPINQACSLMAARLAQRSKHALFGTEQFGGDIGGAAMIRNNDPDYLRLIAPYRRPQVA